MGQLKGHLHYGGSIGKNFTAGSKPAKGRNFRTQHRYETIIRLENAAFPDAAIAAMLCISPGKLLRIKRDPDYLAARIQLTHGIILDNDAKTAQIREQRKEMLTSMLPPALQFLAEEIQRPVQTLAERKHKAALMQDLLDREGTFAKVSRTEIKPVENFDFEKADAASQEIIHALRSAAPPQVGLVGKSLKASTSSLLLESLGHHTAEALAANEEFSNSHTLSAVDQQAALDELELAEKELLLEIPSASKEIN